MTPPPPPRARSPRRNRSTKKKVELADQTARALDLARAGNSLREIAKVLGCSHGKVHRLIEAADRIEVRVGLAEADYQAAYRAAIRINPPSASESTRYDGGHEMSEDLLDAVEAAVHTGRLEEARDLAAWAIRLNLAEVSPRGAAVSAAVSAMTTPDCDAEALYQSALAHPDVVAVITAADIPGENNFAPRLGVDPLLVDDEVTYVGQPIAVVVATSRRAAEQAAVLVTATI